MPNRLETAIAQHRAALRAIDRAAMAEVFSAYQDVMDRLAPLIELTRQQAEADGIVTPFELFQLERYQELQRQTAIEMERLAQLTGDVTAQAQARAIRESIDAARGIAIASARGTAATAEIAIGWTSLPTSAVEDLIGATRSGPLAELIGSFGDDMARVLTEELVSGLALGQGPRKVAASVARATEIGRNRALTIARTEMLRSARSASLSSYNANRDILAGWIWTASHSGRTCAACLAMDGTKHDHSESFDSHVNCRCAPRPWLRDVPMRNVQSGEHWLSEQPADVQDAVLGKAGGQAYRDGEVELSDFIRVDESEDWGRSVRDGGIAYARLIATSRGRLAA